MGFPISRARTLQQNGVIGGSVCVGEVIQICTKATQTVPVFNTLKGTGVKEGLLLLEQCVEGQYGSVTQDLTPAFIQQAASMPAGLVANTKAEFAIQICLGITGLTEVLNTLGISLCLDLITADLWNSRASASSFRASTWALSPSRSGARPSSRRTAPSARRTWAPPSRGSCASARTCTRRSSTTLCPGLLQHAEGPDHPRHNRHP